ncbi:hypothetical protein [Pseudomonas lini]
MGMGMGMGNMRTPGISGLVSDYFHSSLPPFSARPADRLMVNYAREHNLHPQA